MATATWSEREQRILDAIATAEEEHFGTSDLDRFAREAVPDIDYETWKRAVARLEEAGYVRARINRGDDKILSVHAQGLTERGLRATGVWPAEEAANAVLELLDERLAAETDPDERTKLQKFRDDLYAMGTAAAGGLISEVLKRVAGL